MNTNPHSTVIQQMTQQLAKLDAAGVSIVTLRCSLSSEIRSVIEAYHHKNYGTIREVTGLNTVRLFRSRFEWDHHGLDTSRSIHGEKRSLMQYLTDCTGASSGHPYQLLYIPDLFRVIGTDSATRSEIQNQYLALLEDIALAKRQGKNNVLIVVGCTDGHTCPELAEYNYIVDIPHPEHQEILNILLDACTQCAGSGHELEPDKANRLAEAMRGFYESEIRHMIRLAFADHPHPMRDLSKVLAIVHEIKRQRIDQVKGLRWIDTAEPVGGMDQLQDFLKKKGTSFRNPHLAKLQCAQPPQAILLYGPPGCGKSLAADWAAKLLGGEEPLPLLHFDIGSMLEKWVGQSEANYETAMGAVESIAPCVLVIEELDKLFGTAGKESSSEVGNNLFSLFLQWMERPKAKPILVMATANRIQQLPPESERKGRFDEVFSVSIPTGQECLDIFRLHLKNYDAVLPLADGSTDAATEAITTKFLMEATRLRRFLTGADIKIICKMIFAECFHKYYGELNEAQRRQAMAESQTRRYDLNDILFFVREELTKTRTFLSGNMDVAAQYWLQTYLWDSLPASSYCVVHPSSFDSKTGKVTISNRLPSDYDFDQPITCDSVAELYDLVLREALAQAITQRYKSKS